MITKENRGSGTVDILKQNLRERPQDVAQILLERAIGKNTQRLAILKRGEDMYVVTPESISVQLWFAGDFEPEVTNTLEAILKKGMVLRRRRFDFILPPKRNGAHPDIPQSSFAGCAPIQDHAREHRVSLSISHWRHHPQSLWEGQGGTSLRNLR